LKYIVKEHLENRTLQKSLFILFHFFSRVFTLLFDTHTRTRRDPNTSCIYAYTWVCPAAFSVRLPSLKNKLTLCQALLSNRAFNLARYRCWSTTAIKSSPSGVNSRLIESSLYFCRNNRPGSHVRKLRPLWRCTDTVELSLRNAEPLK